MNLEDHLGDIVRKARLMTGTTPAATARAAQVSEAALAALEDSGELPAKINLAALAQIIGLAPEKFAGIAKGWLPAAPDLAGWRELRQFVSSGGGLTVNSHLIWDVRTREAALFDTGIDATPVLACLAQNNLSLRHIFITHSHWDHVEALPGFRAAWPAAQLHSSSAGAPLGQRNQAGETISLGTLRITHRLTPGHADDGVTYLVEGWPGQPGLVAMVGDTILAGSMCNGNGQWEIARQKIRSEILTLPAATLLCPGHGPCTTVGEETLQNPFF
jgi:glyoxylase-like metal-dependent hydrolase (beta-lactamase superfamily II)